MSATPAKPAAGTPTTAVRRVRAGDGYAARVGEGLYALCEAPEDGYLIQAGGEPVFVSAAALRRARRAAAPAAARRSGRILTPRRRSR